MDLIKIFPTCKQLFCHHSESAEMSSSHPLLERIIKTLSSVISRHITKLQMSKAT